MKPPKFLPAILAICAVLAVASGPALAQSGNDARASESLRSLPPTAPDSTMHIQLAQSGTDRRATDIIRSLAPMAPNALTTTQTRTARKPVRINGVMATASMVEVVIDRAYSVDFDVYFAFDSVALDPDARRSLQELGHALSSPELAAHRFLIAGHTDAKGADGYNLRLSTQRARAVRSYLLDAFPIDPGNLFTYGFGESDLKDPGHPTAGINRRVEVALIVEAP